MIDSTLKAGRELDALVAERVMGAHVLRRQGVDDRDAYFDWGDQTRGYASTYSTDIAAAWTVVEKLTPINCNQGQFGEFELLLSNNYYQVRFGGQTEFTGADTAPLAICLAALKAVEK